MIRGPAASSASQGHRIKNSPKQELFKERGVPGCFFSLLLQAGPRSVLFEQRGHEASQETHVLGSMTLPNSAAVFAKHDIHYPMQTVLDPPVPTSTFTEQADLRVDTTDVITRLARLDAVPLNLTNDSTDRNQLRPLLAVLDQRFGKLTRGVAALNPWLIAMTPPGYDYRLDKSSTFRCKPVLKAKNSLIATIPVKLHLIQHNRTNPHLAQSAKDSRLEAAPLGSTLLVMSYLCVKQF